MIEFLALLNQANNGAFMRPAMLGIYGADRARWPARERLKYSGFIGETAEARRLVAEVAALDKLLDRAPAPKTENLDVLAARIMASAGAAPANGRGGVTQLRPRAAVARSAEDDRLLGWPAAALLAASLVLGVFAGTAGMVDEPMQSITALTVPDTDTDDDASRLAFGSDDGSLNEEDTL